MTSFCALGLAYRCKGRRLFTVVPVGCSGVDLVFSASPAVPPTPLPGELRETAQQSTYVVGIAVVVDETVQHPLLSVVGTDLDPIHDRFGLMTQHLAVDGEVHKAHVRWQ